MARENLHFGASGEPFMKSMIGADVVSFFSLAIRFIRAEVGLTGPRSPPPAAAPPLDESAFSSPSSAVLITRNAFEVNFCP